MRTAVVHGLGRGGAARRLSGTLSAMDDDVSIQTREFFVGVCTQVGAAAPSSVSWEPRSSTVGHVLRPPLRYLDQASNHRAWSGLWEQVNQWGPDVVFVNPCAYPGGAVPGIERAAAPTVYYCDEPRRSDYEPEAMSQTRRLTRWPYLPLRKTQRRHERRSVASATVLLTNSRYTASYIERVYGRTATVAAPGISTLFRPDPSVPTERFLLSVGALIPSKGHDLAIRALAASDADLTMRVVAPRPDPPEAARLQTIAESLGVKLRIAVGVTDEHLLDLYRRAWATIYLARAEPLGLVSLEAQASGCPVVVAREGGLADTVQDGLTGYAVTRDVDGVVRALSAIGAPLERKRLATNVSDQVFLRDTEAAAAMVSSLKATALS